MIGLAFMGFFVSILGATPLMLSTARTIRRNDTTDQLPDRLGKLAYVVSVSGFAVGALSLILFAMRNL